MVLGKLSDGWYYAGRDGARNGAEVMDHNGVWYRVEYTAPQVSIPTPEPVKDWRADLPTVALSPEAVHLVKALKEGLSYEPVEHFLSVGIDVAGDVVFEDWQHGDGVHCAVDYERIVAKAKESKAVGVSCYHNHPFPHPAQMSEPDKQVTAALERKLAKEYITLHEHVVVKGRQVATRESELDYPTDWHARQAALEHRQATEPAWLQQIRRRIRG